MMCAFAIHVRPVYATALQLKGMIWTFNGVFWTCFE